MAIANEIDRYAMTLFQGSIKVKTLEHGLGLARGGALTSGEDALAAQYESLLKTYSERLALSATDTASAASRFDRMSARDRSRFNLKRELADLEAKLGLTLRDAVAFARRAQRKYNRCIDRLVAGTASL